MQFSFTRSLLTYFVLFVLLGFTAEMHATTYFISATGNDSNSGTATNAAWKTVTKVNSKAFTAGDEIRFEGGKSFSGQLSFDAADKGTTNNRIVISSYGNGRATINGGNGSAFYAYNFAAVTISNLNFVGAGAGNTADGVVFYGDLAGGAKLSGITIDNVDVSGFGKCGINMGTWNGSTAYRDVRITYTSMHDNVQAGMGTYAQVANANENFYVGHCVAFNNFGNPASAKNTGSGIVLGDVNGAIIERCVAYENGKNNFAGSEGPAGIWCYDSTNVVIQYNESFRNHTATVDGDGFDLDINVKNSVMQHNYSHDNDGAGFLLCAGPSNDGNIVRYNISQNDGRKTGYGAIHSYGAVSNAKIYNNTVYLSQTTGNPRAVWLYSATTNVRVYNNIFLTTGGARLLDVGAGQSGLLFQGNDYFTSGSAFSIVYNGTSYSSFNAWQTATAQEKLNGTNVGLNVDPKLLVPGTGGTFTNADALATLSSVYSLQASSPLIDRGVNAGTVTGFTGKDFFGNSTPAGNGYDIGAGERVSTTVTRLAPVIQSANRIQLTLSGPSGKTNVVEVTTNFVRWDVLTNAVNVSGTVTFTDSTTNSKSKFYRVRAL